MVITFSILGLVLLILVVFLFTESIGEVIVITAVALFFMYQCDDDFKEDISGKSIEIRCDTSLNGKLIEVK